MKPVCYYIFLTFIFINVNHMIYIVIIRCPRSIRQHLVSITCISSKYLIMLLHQFACTAKVLFSYGFSIHVQLQVSLSPPSQLLQQFYFRHMFDKKYSVHILTGQKWVVTKSKCARQLSSSYLLNLVMNLHKQELHYIIFKSDQPLSDPHNLPEKQFKTPQK